MKYAKNIVLTIILILIIIIGNWAVRPNIAPDWVGFGPYDEDLSGPRAKTLWDWLDLLIVPTFLALGAWILSITQKENESKLELDRQRQNSLNAFIEQISKLLLDKNLRTSEASEVRSIARTYSLAIFRTLDKNRKAEALQFLFESRLISKNPIVILNGADLSQTMLNNASLVNTEIKGAYFNDASMKDANLSESNFCGSDFSNVDFSGAILENADLSFTILKNANFNKVDLTKTNLDCAILAGASLMSAKLKPEQLKQIASLDKAKLPKEDKEHE